MDPIKIVEILCTICLIMRLLMASNAQSKDDFSRGSYHMAWAIIHLISVLYLSII